MGVSMPLTGAGFAAVGKLLGGAFKVYLAQNDGMVGGRKIESSATIPAIPTMPAASSRR